jgi:hypothetical protein
MALMYDGAGVPNRSPHCPFKANLFSRVSVKLTDKQICRNKHLTSTQEKQINRKLHKAKGKITTTNH